MSPSASQPRSRILSVDASGLSDMGQVRKHNEDAFLIDEEICLFIVADGMGGHRGGETASNMAVQLLPHVYRERIAQCPAPVTQDALVAAFGASVAEVSRRIHEAGKQKAQLHRMGTTLVAILVARGYAHVTHLGDSRAYVLRNRALHQLTEDHSVANRLVQLGALKPEDVERHPAKNQLTSYAGIHLPVQPDVAMLRLRSGDRFLLCTDGVWATVPPTEIRDILAESASARAACRRLVAKGNANGGPDNLTALVVDYGEAQTQQVPSKKNTVKLTFVTTQLVDLSDEEKKP